MDKKRFPEPFKYCEYYVEDFIKNANFNSVRMSGMYKTLRRLRDVLNMIFKEVNLMTYEMEYFGWRGEDAKNMHRIENEIVQRLLEIYVICNMGLGEDIYEESSCEEEL